MVDRPVTKFKYKFLIVEDSSEGEVTNPLFTYLHTNNHMGKQTIIADRKGAIF